MKNCTYHVDEILIGNPSLQSLKQIYGQASCVEQQIYSIITLCRSVLSFQRGSTVEVRTVVDANRLPAKLTSNYEYSLISFLPVYFRLTVQSVQSTCLSLVWCALGKHHHKLYSVFVKLVFLERQFLASLFAVQPTKSLLNTTRAIVSRQEILPTTKHNSTPDKTPKSLSFAQYLDDSCI